MSETAVLLSVVEDVPEQWIEDLRADLKAAGVPVHVEVRRQGIAAGVIWLLVSSAALFVASKYFGGIAQEAGRDTYHHKLKPALRRFAERINSTKATWMTSSSGKLPDERPGLLTIAIGPTPDRALRFVFPEGEEQCSAALEALFELLEREGDLDRAQAVFEEVSGGGRDAWKLICRYFGREQGWMLYAPLTGQKWDFRGPEGTEG